MENLLKRLHARNCAGVKPIAPLLAEIDRMKSRAALGPTAGSDEILSREIFTSEAKQAESKSKASARKMAKSRAAGVAAKETKLHSR